MDAPAPAQQDPDNPRTSNGSRPRSVYAPPVEPNRYHPKYWLTWVAIGGLAIVGRMPRKSVLRIGMLCGLLFYAFNAKRRHYAMVNLELCFPDWPIEKRRQLVRDHFKRYGQAIVDLGMLWNASEQYVEQQLRIKGMNHWVEAKSTGRPIIFLVPHMVATDMAGTLLARQMPLCAMMKELRNKVFNHRVVKGRSRFGMQLYSRSQGISKLISDLRNGVGCVYIPDQDFGAAEGTTVFVHFFAAVASTLTTLGRMAKITNAIVLPLYPYLDPETGLYHVTIAEPLTNFPTNDKHADARAMNAIFEETISRAPEQYVWTLRWFKSRPNNEPNPY